MAAHHRICQSTASQSQVLTSGGICVANRHLLGFMTHVTCRLTAQNWDQLRNPTLGNRVWAIFTFFTQTHIQIFKVSDSTLTAVERSQLLAGWPGTHSRISSGIQQTTQTILGIYLKRTRSHITSASSALGVLTIMRYTNPRTHSLSLTVAREPYCTCRQSGYVGRHCSNQDTVSTDDS